MNKLEQLKNNPEFQRVLADSFGGVMYNVANFDKYNKAEIFALWDQLDPGEQGAAGGIVEGAINFLRGN